MRKLCLLSLALGASIITNAQSSKNYKLTVVAEGNFGTPNGDLFHVQKQNQQRTVHGPLYQSANNSTSGVDVLQDFDVWHTKAILCGKGSHPMKLAIVNYPNMDTVFTVNSGLGAGLQRCGMVSDHKAYIIGANSSVVKYVDIDNQTIGNVSDPSNHFATGIHSMIGYNAAMYVANGSKVAKIDTTNHTTVASITTGLTAINTMVKDTANNCLWLLGKSGTTNALVKIQVNNNDAVSTPIMLTGFTNAKLLRVGPNKLYFVSGSGFYVYDLTAQVVPTVAVYTSVFTGFSAMYDRSFTVDPISGDFAYTTAGAYVAPALFDIVDGTGYTRIDSGSVTGAAIPNELILTTWMGSGWDTTSLPNLYAECEIDLIAPTAAFIGNNVMGTTAQLNYNTQGIHSIEWKYLSGDDSITQFQSLTIADTSAPVADIATLPNLAVSCPYTVTAPTATDNCNGAIVGNTDSLTFTTAGTYNIIWTYTDAVGNVSTQQQALTVTCEGTAIREIPLFKAVIYPNPARANLIIDLSENEHYQISLVNTVGQLLWSKYIKSNKLKVNVAELPEGLYLLHITNSKGQMMSKKVIVQH